MSQLDPVLLARFQFGFTISFHIVFPAITIGLGSYLAVLEGLWLLKKDEVYLDLYHFWSKAFAVNFGMGVVSGLVMAYEFGTNWSGFSAFAGGVTGPLLAYEVLTAFFLEAGFLGVMLFGWRKVGPGLHFFATLMVAAGTLVSMTWILASNSWMQTPQGYEIIAGRIVPTDWLAVIFNPSFPYRLVHMALAAFLFTALFVGAAGAWHLLKYRDNPRVKTMFSMAMWMVLVAAPIQILAGDQHGLNTLKYQPAKIAAMEGDWSAKPGEGEPLILFGLPDMAQQKTLDAIEIPRVGSLILTHTWDGQIKGLDDSPSGSPEFDSHLLDLSHHGRPGHADVAAGRRRRMASLARAALPTAPLPALRGGDGSRGDHRHAVRLDDHRDRAAAMGGLRRHAHRRRGIAPLGMVLSASLLMFILVYFAVFGTGIIYLLKVVAVGPDRSPPIFDADHPPHRPSRPLSATPAIDPLSAGE